MPDYSNGKIYKIIGPDDSKYIGSTTQELRKRFSSHKYGYTLWKNGRGHFITCFELFEKHGVDKCNIQLIEEFSCSNRKELEEREGIIIKESNCINKVIAGRTRNEWTNVNRDKIREKNSIWYNNNRDRVKELHKLYNNKNQYKIAEQKREYYKINKIKIDEREKIYRTENHQKVREKNRKYRENNKEIIKQKAATRWLENRDAINEKARMKYHARKITSYYNS